MKKNYTTPKAEVIKIAQTNIVCATTPDSDKTIEVADSSEDNFTWEVVN